MRRPIIIGIDPGTTVGYAVLDLNGEMVEVNSSKIIDRSHLIQLVTDIGVPVLVATDKNPAPQAVSKIATLLGARLVVPSTDMLVQEKLTLTRELSVRNDHERDALAAALRAQKEVRGLLLRIDKFIEEKGCQSIEGELKRLVVGSGISIRTAAALLTVREPEHKKTVQRIASHRDTRRDYLALLEAHVSLKDELGLVRKQRDNLHEQLKRTSARPRLKILDPDLKAALERKDRSLSSMLSQLTQLRKRLVSEERERNDLRAFLLDNGSYRVVKILDDLGVSGFAERKRLLKIHAGDLIYVRDTTRISPKVLDELSMVQAFIAENAASVLRGYPVISPKDLNMRFLGDIAFADRTAVERSLDRSQMLSRVIRDYQKRGTLDEEVRPCAR
jgi:uncharacterized protein